MADHYAEIKRICRNCVTRSAYLKLIRAYADKDYLHFVLVVGYDEHILLLKINNQS
ncbi:MAG: hypothetical protein IJM37_10795 [Lachnospiraceae bacterium]|nr:hypothetical protein [Lachnospiraceae bacterium]